MACALPARCTAVRRVGGRGAKAFVRPAVRPRAFNITVHDPTSGEVKSFSCEEHESILDAAEGAGMALPQLCRLGACGACAGKVLAGRVEQDEQTFLSASQQHAGFALLCVAHPKADCVVLADQETAVEAVLPTQTGGAFARLSPV